ncbi:Carboxypeptidase Taq [Truepera radiovictrix DSM 17093]|uniref:Carboxypeptidase Taq n=1 Tax=Truepera radiovictrix (strain DSM 17093 / CIP 108686 / LMG 22925 / RQ-24) TaxID=649638 RepID=D7CUK0_TRURR|nr:Carboxypeptidase Taq [Truepera radiovictrix DSM 17093]
MTFQGDLNGEQEAAFAALREAFGVISDLSQAQSLLSWDESVNLPPKAAATRGQQLATLGQVIHERLTDPRLKELLRALEGVDPESEVGAFVREARRDVERAQKVPSDFVAEVSRARSAALAAWTEARAEADFARFAPHLEKTLELSRRYADFLGFEGHPYNALHDLYEPGSDVETLKRVFAELRDATVTLLREIAASGRVLSDAPVRRPFAEADQEAFGRFVVRALGYDFEGGRLDRTVHPFATRIGQGDVRITTRYEPTFLNPALFGTIHEAGHAMYEQGIAARYARSPLEHAVSLGVHESQSRLWENLVGRSLPFWRWAYPKLQEIFPEALAGVALEDFYAAVNRVEPSLIRVEADEVTYNLHVMVRFELELALLEGSLTVRELPEAWNARYEAYLGVVPPDDAVGCLQDTGDDRLLSDLHARQPHERAALRGRQGGAPGARGGDRSRALRHAPRVVARTGASTRLALRTRRTPAARDRLGAQRSALCGLPQPQVPRALRVGCVRAPFGGALLGVLLGAVLSVAAAQIGEPPEALVERLELREAGERYALGGLTLELTPRGGALYRVSGRGVLDEVGRRDLAQLVGAATGYGEGIAAPLAEFLAARTEELTGQGEVGLNVEEFALRLTVTPDPVRVGGAPHVRFELELAAVPEDRFPAVRHTLGPADAAVVVRAFSDLQCPFCARYGLEVLPELKATLLARGDVRFEFHHLPLLSIHANAAPAAEAAECVTDANAGDPEAFWTFHDALLERQGAWRDLGDPAPYFVRLAREVGLSAEGVAACLTEGHYTETVREAYALATQTLGLSATPTVFVGPYRLPTAAAGTAAGYERAIARLETFGELPASP